MTIPSSHWLIVTIPSSHWLIVSLVDSYNTAILQLVVALQVTFMPLQFSRLLIFIVSIPFRWELLDQMIVIIIAE